MDDPPAAVQTLVVPKGTEAPPAEDAASARPDAWPVRAAVADGATESAFAGAWAEQLARGVVAIGVAPDALQEAMPDWQDGWRAAVDDRVQEGPWYVEAKAEDGAYATLLGLEVTARGRWRAVAVGDSCLFHLRDGALLRGWPLTDPDAFDHRPALVPSRTGVALPSLDTAAGTWKKGDLFLLATDAVAAWLLGTGLQENGRAGLPLPDPEEDGRDELVSWSELSEDAFRQAVKAARARGHLRNDDATLLMLRMTVPPDPDA